MLFVVKCLLVMYLVVACCFGVCLSSLFVINGWLFVDVRCCSLFGGFVVGVCCSSVSVLVDGLLVACCCSCCWSMLPLVFVLFDYVLMCVVVRCLLLFVVCCCVAVCG